MGQPVVTVAANLRCPHGGPAILASPPRVLAGGSPVLTIVPPLPVGGCPLGGQTAGGGETGKRYVFKVAVPCQRLVFPAGTRRVLSGGVPLLVLGATGIAVPSSTPVVAAVPGQLRVLAD